MNDTKNLNPDELRALARELEEKARQQAREMQAAAARKAQEADYDRRDAALRAVLAAVRKARPAVIIDDIPDMSGRDNRWSAPGLYTKEQRFPVQIEMVEEHSAGSRCRTGKYRVVLSGHGDWRTNMSQYPQRKDGTYSYEKIAADFWARYDSIGEAQKRRERTAQIRKESNGLIAALRANAPDVNILVDRYLRASEYDERCVRLSVTLDRDVSPALALEILRALAATGVTL